MSARALRRLQVIDREGGMSRGFPLSLFLACLWLVGPASGQESLLDTVLKRDKLIVATYSTVAAWDACSVSPSDSRAKGCRREADEPAGTIFVSAKPDPIRRRRSEPANNPGTKRKLPESHPDRTRRRAG
jgi:hypothetical protein